LHCSKPHAPGGYVPYYAFCRLSVTFSHLPIRRIQCSCSKPWTIL